MASRSTPGLRPAILELFSIVAAPNELFLRFALAPMVAASIYLASLPLSATTARFALARTQMQIPYAAWAAMQPVPSMYSFEHRWTVVAGDGTRILHRWINHHPTRVLYEPESRPMRLLGLGCIRHTLESRYRSERRVTHYEMCRNDHDQRILVKVVP